MAAVSSSLSDLASMLAAIHQEAKADRAHAAQQRRATAAKTFNAVVVEESAKVGWLAARCGARSPGRHRDSAPAHPAALAEQVRAAVSKAREDGARQLREHLVNIKNAEAALEQLARDADNALAAEKVARECTAEATSAPGRVSPAR